MVNPPNELPSEWSAFVDRVAKQVASQVTTCRAHSLDPVKYVLLEAATQYEQGKSSQEDLAAMSIVLLDYLPDSPNETLEGLLYQGMTINEDPPGRQIEPIAFIQQIRSFYEDH